MRGAFQSGMENSAVLILALWRPWWSLLEGEGSEEVVPGWEDEKNTAGGQMVEEAGARGGLVARRLPQPIDEVSNCVAGERQEVEDDEHGGEVILAVAEIVFEIVALGLERVESLVLDLPAGSAAGGEFDDVGAIDRQIGDEAVAVGDLAGGVDDLYREPVDAHGILAVAQGQIAQPAVDMAKALLAAFDRFDPLAEFDAGELFRQRRVRGRLAHEQEVALDLAHGFRPADRNKDRRRDRWD